MNLYTTHIDEVVEEWVRLLDISISLDEDNTQVVVRVIYISRDRSDVLIKKDSMRMDTSLVRDTTSNLCTQGMLLNRVQEDMVSTMT